MPIALALTRRRFLSAVGLTSLVLFLLSHISGRPSSLLARSHQTPIKEAHEPSPPPPTPTNTTRVPLEIHLMSKCPDARDCLRNLVVPAMQQVADKVDFRLSYLGS